MSNLQGGVATSQTVDFAKQRVIDVNKTRYLFNPFEVVDLRNGVAPYGHPYLENGKFIEIGTVHRLVTNAKAERSVKGNSRSDNTHDAGLYHPEAREAMFIARDLTTRYAEKGVVEIESIANAAEADMLSKLVLGTSIPSVEDINNPGFPVPVIPAWLEQIARNAKTAAKELKEAGAKDIAEKVTACTAEVRASLATAINYCQRATMAARERIADAKAINRFFDAHEKRCLLALGEEIPMELPLLTASQNAASDIDAKVTSAVEKVFSAIADKINPPAEAKTVATTAPVVTETNWAKEPTELYTEEDAAVHAGKLCAAKTAKGTQCKSKPKENGFCTMHQPK